MNYPPYFIVAKYNVGTIIKHTKNTSKSKTFLFQQTILFILYKALSRHTRFVDAADIFSTPSLARIWQSVQWDLILLDIHLPKRCDGKFQV